MWIDVDLGPALAQCLGSFKIFGLRGGGGGQDPRPLVHTPASYTCPHSFHAFIVQSNSLSTNSANNRRWPTVVLMFEVVSR